MKRGTATGAPMPAGVGSGDARQMAAYRLGIASRAFLAIFGGYAVAALAAASLSLALPLPRAQAVLTATMLAFLFYCALAIWAFCARSAKRAWGVSLVLALLPLLHLLVIKVWQ